MMETLIQWDKSLFRFINQSLYSDAMDTIMHYISERWFWFPVYLLLIIYLVYLFRRRALWIIAATLLLIASSDLISAKVVKPLVQRHRPCRAEANLGFSVRILPGAGCSEYGFVSSHASNSFGMVVFFGLLFYKRNKWWMWGGLVWASVIGFSRIYLGQHYPSDIVGGAILGALLALMWHKLLLLVSKE